MDKFDLNKQKRLKVLSKIIYIVTKLLKIFSYIAIPFIMLAMVIIPILINKVSVKDNKISINDNVISIEDKKGMLSISVNGVKVADETDRDSIIRIKDILKDFSKGTIIAASEVALAFTLISIIIMITLLRQVEKLFKNIYSKDTPFILDNVNHIRKIAIMMIISIVIPIVSNTIMSVIISHELNIHISSFNIIEILIVFILSYIFEYGCLLQTKSIEKIYENIN